MSEGAAGICHVCEEALIQPNIATCHGCGRDFHLQMRTDVPGKDCGAVWIHEERLHLEFGCHACLGAGVAGGQAR